MSASFQWALIFSFASCNMYKQWQIERRKKNIVRSLHVALSSFQAIKSNQMKYKNQRMRKTNLPLTWHLSGITELFEIEHFQWSLLVREP